MVREICSDCTNKFASDGKLCRLHSGATMGEPAASGRYWYTTDQESQEDCSVSCDSDHPLLLNEVEIVEPYIHDKTRSVKDDQKCDRQSECALSNDYLEKSTDLNKLEDNVEKSSGNLILKRNRNNCSDDNHYKGYDVLKKAELDQEDQSSVKSGRKIFKRKLSKKRLQESGKENLDGSVRNSLECSFPNAYLGTSINVASLEDSENNFKLSKRQSITSSVDSLAVEGPYSITKKTNESNISSKSSQFKLSKEERITSSDDSLAVPGSSFITKKTDASKFSSKTSQSKLSERENIIFSVDSLAVPGPSGITKKTNDSNIGAKTSQSEYSFEDQSDVEDKSSRSICKKCERKISEHISILNGKHLYKCCVCNYRNANMFNLEMHDYNSACRLSNVCNYCNELIWDLSKHCNNRTCVICGLTFHCITELENHTLFHEKYFKWCCRVCGSKISEHIFSDEKEFYKCCKCDFIGIKFDLINHLHIHQDLQLFKCDLCDKRFEMRSSLAQHLRSHFKCKKCVKNFYSYESLLKHNKNENNSVGTKG